VTCRRKRYDELAAQIKIERIVSQDAAVGLDTTGRLEWCAECEAWHVETKAAWREVLLFPGERVIPIQQLGKDAS